MIEKHSSKNYEVTIIGGGPGASSAALTLLKRGVRPLIVEKEEFPRYHIGESLTGECGNCLREFGLEELMHRRGFPVKHGVTVWGTGGKNSFWVPVQRRDESGRLRDTTTWQVRRDEFDLDLLNAALAAGAEHLRGEATDLIRSNGEIAGIQVRTSSNETLPLKSKVVIDASGQSTFLANRGVTGPKERGRYSRQVALFTQVTGAARDEGAASGNTLIFYQKKHHWAWFIPLSETVTSVGVVVPSEIWKEGGETPAEYLRRSFRELNPELSRRMTKTNWVEPVRTISNYSYEVPEYTGPGFVCIGDAHRFVDPIFSFGVFFAMQEGKMAAHAIADFLEGKDAPTANPFAEFERRASLGQRIVQDLIDCFWEHPLAFQRMAHHSHIEEITDCFAGRIYQEDGEVSDAVRGMRRLLARSHDVQPEFV